MANEQKGAAAGGKKKPRKTRTPLAVRTLRKYLGPAAGAMLAGALVADRITGGDPNSPWHRMLHLHHKVPGKDLYTRGADDIYLVIFWVLALIFGRYILQRQVLVPLGRYGGIKGELNLTKFAEQGWQVLYYSTAWVTGLTIMLNTEGWDWTDTSQLWEGYPHKYLTAKAKLYYLLQLAFWISQIFVTLVEEWRADFIEMMTHHVITIILIGWSFFLNLTRSGIAILVEQDFADIFLPLAKMFKYLKKQRIADVIFAIFALAWIPTRHGVFFIIYYSLMTEAPVILKDAYDPENGAYWSTNGTYYPLLALLGLLQVLLLIWLKALLIAVWRALRGNDLDDIRSDNEDEDEDEGNNAKKDDKKTK